MNLTKDLCVADLMTRNATTVNDTDDLTTAIGAMATQMLTAFPVVDREGKICGVLSAADLTSLTYALHCDVAVLPVVSDPVRKTLTDALTEDNCDRRVSHLMTHTCLTASPAMTIKAAGQTMVENSIHHLPVVDANQVVIGIISTMDIERSIAYGVDE